MAVLDADFFTHRGHNFTRASDASSWQKRRTFSLNLNRGLSTDLMAEGFPLQTAFSASGRTPVAPTIKRMTAKHTEAKQVFPIFLYPFGTFARAGCIGCFGGG